MNNNHDRLKLIFECEATAMADSMIRAGACNGFRKSHYYRYESLAEAIMQMALVRTEEQLRLTGYLANGEYIPFPVGSSDIKADIIDKMRE